MAQIEFREGDLFSAGVEALVNTVNCVGVMGRGIALQFKKAYPANFVEYAEACKAGEVNPGKMFVHETGKFSPRFIVNFPTKRHWRGKSRIEDIQSGLVDLAKVISERKIKSIAIPPLGSGLGGLDWNTVRKLIVAGLNDIPELEVIIFEPRGAPEVVKSKEVPAMTAGRAALVGLTERYLAALMDPLVTLIELQKLMYFLQAAGQPLRLKFEKGPYGPYANNLRHVLNQIEGHLITGYQDGGDQPFKELRLVPGATSEASRFFNDDADLQARMDRVQKLVEGFETPYGLELLATVHWTVSHSPDANIETVVQAIHRWNDRKKQFTPRQIEIALRRLIESEWALPTVVN